MEMESITEIVSALRSVAVEVMILGEKLQANQHTVKVHREAVARAGLVGDWQCRQRRIWSGWIWRMDIY